MSPATRVPVKEYLAASYRPDCDYVEGQVVSRNTGEFHHSLMLSELAGWFHSRQQQLNILVLLSVRFRINAERYRVPDVAMVSAPYRGGPVLTEALLCIEVLSPEDRMGRIEERIDDYLAAGVPTVWVLDPETRRAWLYNKHGLTPVRDGLLHLAEPELAVPVTEFFGILDEHSL